MARNSSFASDYTAPGRKALRLRKVIKGMEVLTRSKPQDRLRKDSVDIQFNIEVVNKRDHAYTVKKLN